MTGTELLGYWCIVISLAFVWPQVWRTVRHDTTHGISPFGTLHAMAGAALWFTYGTLERLSTMWISNASFVIAQVIICSVLLRHGRLPRRMVALFVTAELVLLTVGLTGTNAVLGWIAIFVSGSGMIPNVIHVRSAPNLHGISIVSWAMTVVAATSWTLYGWVKDDHIIMYVNYFTIPLMFYVIAKAAMWRNANDVPLFGRAA